MTYEEYISQQQQAIDEEQPDDSCFLEYHPEEIAQRITKLLIQKNYH